MLFIPATLYAAVKCIDVTSCSILHPHASDTRHLLTVVPPRPLLSTGVKSESSPEMVTAIFTEYDAGGGAYGGGSDGGGSDGS